MADKALEVVRAETAGITAWANALVVNTVEDYKGVIERLQESKATRARWVEYWAEPIQSAHRTWSELTAKRKEGTDVLDQAENKAKSKAIAWKREADERAAVYQKKLQAEADLKARLERERLEKEAAKLKTPEKREARMAEAAAVEAPIIQVDSATADIKGATSPKTWVAKVVDLDALIKAATPGTVAVSLLAFNQKAGDAFAKSTKGKILVPGVQFIEVEGMAIRKK